MTTAFPVQDLSFLLGLHVIYEYADDVITADLYIRNSRCVDYRVLEGPLAGRWATRQDSTLTSLGDGLGIVSWAEHTGSTVSLVIHPARRWVYGAAFFAKWVRENPDLTVGHQNDHLAATHDLRDEGPVAPYSPMHQFAEITFLEDRGTDNDDVITCGSREIPPGYGKRRT